MTQPLLSILIPSTIDRRDICYSLQKKIQSQYDFEKVSDYGLYGKDVEYIIFEDDKTLTIGEKRELMYKKANGLYSWQIDSDDSISENAIQLILEAIKSNPEVDVISFEEYCLMDGKEYKSNHSNLYSGWEGDGNSIFPDGFHFHRTIFFKDVIRTELAKSVPIVHCRFGEDNMYADALKPLIKSEIHLPFQIYKYIHISSNYTERYGFDKD